MAVHCVELKERKNDKNLTRIDCACQNCRFLLQLVSVSIKQHALTVVAEKAVGRPAGSKLSRQAGLLILWWRQTGRLLLHGVVTDRYFCVHLIDRFFGN